MNNNLVVVNLEVMEQLDSNIRKAILDLREAGYSDSLFISMPHYLKEELESIIHKYIGIGKSYKDYEYYFGCRYVPAYENQIVVYHPYMLPQFPGACKRIKITYKEKPID